MRIFQHWCWLTKKHLQILRFYGILEIWYWVRSSYTLFQQGKEPTSMALSPTAVPNRIILDLETNKLETIYNLRLNPNHDELNTHAQRRNERSCAVCLWRESSVLYTLITFKIYSKKVFQPQFCASLSVPKIFGLFSFFRSFFESKEFFFHPGLVKWSLVNDEAVLQLMHSFAKSFCRWRGFDLMLNKHKAGPGTQLGS